jgi:aconitase A
MITLCIGRLLTFPVLDHIRLVDRGGLAQVNTDDLRFRRRTPRDITASRYMEFQAKLPIDTPGEAHYFRHRGIVQYVLRSLLD